MAANVEAGNQSTGPYDFDSATDEELDELVGKATADLTSAAPDDETPAEGQAEGPEPEGDEGTEAAGQTEPDAQAGGEAGPEGAEGEEPATTAAEAAAPAAAEDDSKQGQPFKYKADGLEQVFQGFTEMKNGSLRASKEGAQNLRNVITSYVGLVKASKLERRELNRKLQAAQKEKSDREIEAEQVTALFKDLDRMTPEQRWAWAEDFVARKDQIQLAIDRKKLERDRAALQSERQPQVDPEEQQERFTSAVQTEITNTFKRLLAEPDAKYLTDEDKKILWERWYRRATKLVSRAEADDPVLGVKKGQLIFDDSDVVDDFNDRVNLRRQTKGTLTAAERNARMNADQNGRRIPPTVRGGRPPAAGGKKPGAKDLTKDKRTFKKAFLAGDLDDEGAGE